MAGDRNLDHNMGWWLVQTSPKQHSFLISDGAFSYCGHLFFLNFMSIFDVLLTFFFSATHLCEITSGGHRPQDRREYAARI